MEHEVKPVAGGKRKRASEHESATLQKTPLVKAAYRGKLCSVKALASKGNRYELDEALRMAAGKGHDEVIKFLAKNGGDLFCVDSDGEGLVSLAKRSGETESTAKLLWELQTKDNLKEQVKDPGYLNEAAKALSLAKMKVGTAKWKLREAEALVERLLAEAEIMVEIDPALALPAVPMVTHFLPVTRYGQRVTILPKDIKLARRVRGDRA